VQPIVSWSFEPFKKSRSWRKPELMLACAKQSLLSISRHYSTPIVYTDDIGKYILSILETDCQFDTVLEGCFKNIPTEFWIYPKLLTYSLQNRPYIHFDLDFIVHKQFHERLLSCDIAFQNFEPIKETADAYITDMSNCDLILPDIFNKYHLDKINPPNVGFLLISNMDFNKKYSQAALSIINDNLNYDFSKTNNRYRVNCIIEQQLLGLMLRTCGLTYMPFMDTIGNPRNQYFDHYLGELKNAWATCKELEQHVDTSVKQASAELAKLLS